MYMTVAHAQIFLQYSWYHIYGTYATFKACHSICHVQWMYSEPCHEPIHVSDHLHGKARPSWQKVIHWSLCLTTLYSILRPLEP